MDLYTDIQNGNNVEVFNKLVEIFKKKYGLTREELLIIYGKS